MKECEKALGELLVTVRRLLGPGGCPWDKKQTVQSLAPHAVERLGWEPGEGEAKGRVLDLEGYGPFCTDVVVKDVIYDGNLGATFFEGRTVTLDVREPRAWSS